MKKIKSLTALGALLVTAFVASPGSAKDQPGKAVTLETPRQKVTTTVEGVDYARRTLTFKGLGDLPVTARATKRVKRLDEVTKGDKVIVEYLETVAVVARKPDGKSLAGYLGDVLMAPQGSGDDGFAVETTEILATLDSIDQDRRILVVKLADGTVKTFRASDRIKKLKDLRKGDPVNIKYTEPLLLKVEKVPVPETK